MKYIKFFILSCLFLFPFTSPSYALSDKWCSNGKYDRAINPFPKPNFNKCPAYAQVIMTKKEVEDYYLNGLGKDYLCDLNKNFIFGTPQRRADYKAIKEMFLYKQDIVNSKCEELYRNQSAKKKAEEAKQKAKANVNKEPKEWCISANKFGTQYPTKKIKQCPQTTIEITSKESEKIFLSGSGSKYLANIIENGAICQNDKTDYKFI